MHIHSNLSTAATMVFATMVNLVLATTVVSASSAKLIVDHQRDEFVAPSATGGAAMVPNSYWVAGDDGVSRNLQFVPCIVGVVNCYLDNDNDNYGVTGKCVECFNCNNCATLAGDCDDDDPTVYPNAPELCDGIIDHDCDGSVGPDEYDDDGDGYMRCEGDCDDTDPTVYPGAPELCDGKDTDCDGNYPPEEADNDLDGFMVCEGDCDDFGPFVYPGAPELCDGIDNNCDGVLGPGEVDADGDGYMVCEGDCDDSNPLIHPFGGESCNGIDDNCDGVLGPGEVDADGDGYMVCEGDCDDADPTVYPGAPELCDGKDNDCDGTVDEGCPPPTVPPTPSPSACSDSSLRLKIPKDGTIITRSCEWVARTDTSARCNLIGVSAACPVTCGSCDTCADPELRFKFTYNNMYIARSCEYVGRIENKISGRCAASHNICRQTCGMC